MAYSQAERAKLAKLPAAQQLSFTEQGSTIGKAWSALDESESKLARNPGRCL